MNELYNNIDDRSQAAARNIHIAFDEKAWAKMEALLKEDANTPVAPEKPAEDNAGKTNSRWPQLFLVCFLAGISILLIKNSNTLKNNTLPLIRNEEQNSTAKGRKAKQEANSKNTKQAASEYQYRQTENNNTGRKNLRAKATIDRRITLPVAVNKKYKVSKAASNKNKKPDIKNDLSVAHRNVLVNPGFNFIISKENKIPISKNTKVIPGETHITNLKKIENSQVVEYDDVKKSAEKIQINNPGDVKELVNKDAGDSLNPLKQNKNNNRPVRSSSKHSFLRNFGFTIFISPETNTVKFKSGDKITVSYGAGISYSVGKHFSLRAQLVKAKKEYVTDKNGYHTISLTSFAAIDTLAVNADCKVWDIPLAVRYSFAGNDKKTFFVSAGISSYIMKKEIYDFSYYDQGVYKTNQRIIENENKHVFCNLNLSAGYQYWLNKKWSMGFEPYLKLPLKGIGAGGVKLTSAGTLLSLTFKP